MFWTLQSYHYLRMLHIQLMCLKYTPSLPPIAKQAHVRRPESDNAERPHTVLFTSSSFPFLFLFLHRFRLLLLLLLPGLFLAAQCRISSPLYLPRIFVHWEVPFEGVATHAKFPSVRPPDFQLRCLCISCARNPLPPPPCPLAWRMRIASSNRSGGPVCVFSVPCFEFPRWLTAACYSPEQLGAARQ